MLRWVGIFLIAVGVSAVASGPGLTRARRANRNRKRPPCRRADEARLYLGRDPRDRARLRIAGDVLLSRAMKQGGRWWMNFAQSLGSCSR